LRAPALTPRSKSKELKGAASSPSIGIDACRREIGQTAARIIAACNAEGANDEGQVVELSPKLSLGNTLRSV
tara:strand:+ start:171 stop:386 length:216 start_codon:yes stop_codon:yes gene_type:complete